MGQRQSPSDPTGSGSSRQGKSPDDSVGAVPRWTRSRTTPWNRRRAEWRLASITGQDFTRPRTSEGEHPARAHCRTVLLGPPLHVNALAHRRVIAALCEHGRAASLRLRRRSGGPPARVRASGHDRYAAVRIASSLSWPAPRAPAKAASEARDPGEMREIGRGIAGWPTVAANRFDGTRRRRAHHGEGEERDEERGEADRDRRELFVMLNSTDLLRARPPVRGALPQTGAFRVSPSRSGTATASAARTPARIGRPRRRSARGPACDECEHDSR
jgi:hypothetical protein